MLIDDIKSKPKIYDHGAAERLLLSLDKRFTDIPMPARSLLAGVGGSSPYLSTLMRRDDVDVIALLRSLPSEIVEDACQLAATAAALTDIDHQKKVLRTAKARVALGLALSEITGAITTMDAAALLSDFADAVCNISMRMALQRLGNKGFSPQDAAAPEQNSGIAVLAMGKMGARELNYSSDIDLIVIFDDAAPAFIDPLEAKPLAIAAVKMMVAYLSDQTPDGYVFRTDLRLRPDPSVSAAAVSVSAAEAYYEAHGQNWERAAFIKARPAAGDVALGKAFLQTLRPFIWRKHLDYAAIDDVKSILRQIHAAKGGATIEFEGHDLKTGRGGIREIEFLAQTEQLILGGKDEELRIRQTRNALDLLCERGRLSTDDNQSLQSAYVYLRKVEHRIQMIADDQTHKIPTDPTMIDRLCVFLGEQSVDDFRHKLTGVLGEVSDIAAGMFEGVQSLSATTGPLSFTGVEPDPATLASLGAMGFEEPRRIAEAIRRWHFGELRATRTQRARELLTTLTPRLLEALAAAEEPDDAFLAFDAFLRGLPGGVQIFSLFSYNPAIFDDLIRIMTISPFLGKALAARSDLVEALVEHEWPRPQESRQALAVSLAEALSGDDDFERIINAARRWAAERKFDVTAQLVIGHMTPGEAARQFTDIAEVVIAALAPVAASEMERLHGAIDGAFAVIALGRLGAGTMTAASDIDLIIVYETDHDVNSTGTRAIDGVTYFTRLVRRFITALSTHTEEGALYEVDMQLRPSGRAGPVAVSFDAFRRYYQDDAWTWERMSLVKARVLCGDKALRAKIESEIDDILSRTIPLSRLASDVDDMRQRLAGAKPPRSSFDVKRVRGGLTDIDFLIQYFVLAHPLMVKRSARVSPVRAINALTEQRLLTKEESKTLLNALELFETILQLNRAAAGAGAVSANLSAALEKRFLAALEGAGRSMSLDMAKEKLLDTMQDVRTIYDAHVRGAAGSDGQEEA